MRTLLFLAALGGGYAIARALGASEGWSAGAGWAAAILVFLFGRRRGYRAAFNVERYRRAARQLQTSDPATYEQIVAQADGSEAEHAARRDPDAYVALFLAEANKIGYRV
jgi:hypothetical protein